jgi:fumarate reductase subunit D
MWQEWKYKYYLLGSQDSTVSIVIQLWVGQLARHCLISGMGKTFFSFLVLDRSCGPPNHILFYSVSTRAGKAAHTETVQYAVMVCTGKTLLFVTTLQLSLFGSVHRLQHFCWVTRKQQSIWTATFVGKTTFYNTWTMYIYTNLFICY